jgi:peptidoglycan/xylan/chitin deacetylase (PgdA/CDA1 family)
MAGDPKHDPRSTLRTEEQLRKRSAERLAIRRARQIKRRRITAVVLVLAVISGMIALSVMASSGGGGHTAKPVAADGRPWVPAIAVAASGAVTEEAILGVQSRLSFLAHGGTARKEIALTFDDGPSPFTLKILRVLRAHHARGTFFHVGTMIAEDPHVEAALARSAFAEVGNHTLAHARLDRLSPDDQNAQILGGAQAIISAGGRVPRLFRPPYGMFNQVTLDALKKIGELPVVWSIDSQDYTKPGARAIADRVVSLAEPGSIVLMHDGGGDRTQTLDALPSILDRLTKRGFTFVTVAQMLVDNPPPSGQDRPAKSAL